MTSLEVLRLLVGLPGVLLLPGFAWSFVWWRRGELDAIARAAASLALSVSVVTMAAILWGGFLALPLTTGPAVALVAAVTSGGAALAYARRSRDGPEPS